MDEKKTISAGNGTASGYIVEWRLKEPIVVLGIESRRLPRAEWSQAPYDLEAMRISASDAKLVRPHLSWRDQHISPHSKALYGLVDRDVAEAIMACLKTEIRAHKGCAALHSLVEFRLTECELTYDWKVGKMKVEEE